MVSGFAGKDEAGFEGPVLGDPRGQGQYYFTGRFMRRAWLSLEQG